MVGLIARRFLVCLVLVCLVDETSSIQMFASAPLHDFAEMYEVTNWNSFSICS